MISHGRTSPPQRQHRDLERLILRKLPGALIAGTAIPALLMLLARLWPLAGPPSEVARFTTSVDILAIAAALTVWMTLFPVAIGCLIVIIMKGPVYFADAYPLVDKEHPCDDARNKSSSETLVG